MSVVQNKIIIIVCVCVVVGFSVSMKMKRAVVALCSKSAETRRRRRSFHKKHQGWLVGWLSRGEGGGGRCTLTCQKQAMAFAVLELVILQHM